MEVPVGSRRRRKSILKSRDDETGQILDNEGNDTEGDITGAAPPPAKRRVSFIEDPEIRFTSDTTVTGVGDDMEFTVILPGVVSNESETQKEILFSTTTYNNELMEITQYGGNSTVLDSSSFYDEEMNVHSDSLVIPDDSQSLTNIDTPLPTILNRKAEISVRSTTENFEIVKVPIDFKKPGSKFLLRNPPGFNQNHPQICSYGVFGNAKTPQRPKSFQRVNSTTKASVDVHTSTDPLLSDVHPVSKKLRSVDVHTSMNNTISPVHPNAPETASIDVQTSMIKTKSSVHPNAPETASIDVQTSMIKTKSLVHPNAPETASIDVQTSMIKIKSPVHPNAPETASIDVQTSMNKSISPVHPNAPETASIDVQTSMIKTKSPVHPNAPETASIDVQTSMNKSMIHIHPNSAETASVDVQTSMNETISPVHRNVTETASVDVQTSINQTILRVHRNVTETASVDTQTSMYQGAPNTTNGAKGAPVDAETSMYQFPTDYRTNSSGTVSINAQTSICRTFLPVYPTMNSVPTASLEIQTSLEKSLSPTLPTIEIFRKVDKTEDFSRFMIDLENEGIDDKSGLMDSVASCSIAMDKMKTYSIPNRTIVEPQQKNQIRKLPIIFRPGIRFYINNYNNIRGLSKVLALEEVEKELQKMCHEEIDQLMHTHRAAFPSLWLKATAEYCLLLKFRNASLEKLNQYNKF